VDVEDVKTWGKKLKWLRIMRDHMISESCEVVAIPQIYILLD